MKTYFITVRDEQVAKAIDPNAKLIRTLPATELWLMYCCRPGESHPVPPALIYQVEVNFRREAEDPKGVIRCRAKEPASYKKHLSTWIC